MDISTETTAVDPVGSPGRAAYSINEICKRNNLGRTLVYDEMNAGRLKFLKAGNRRIITADQERSWHELLAAQTKAT